jgi:hypothetical protein
MFWIGIIVGFILAGLIFLYIMKRYMIAHFKMEGSFQDVEKAIKEVVPQFEGWSFPIPDWQFYKSQLSKNFTYDNITNMVMHFVCKPAHANKILRVDPNFGGIMPCTWAVYEKNNGEVYIAKMNIALMSKMYFGLIGRIMTDVARTEEAMLSKIKEKINVIKSDNPASKDNGNAFGGSVIAANSQKHKVSEIRN